MNSCEVFDQETGQNSFETSEAEEEYELPTPRTPRKTQTGTVIGSTHSQSSYVSPSIRRPIQRSLCSPSARRRQVKQNDCRFCDADLPSSGLINHLKKAINKSCNLLYLKLYRVSSLESLVAKLFSCEMCYEQKRINFQSHLGRNKECLKKFQQKFGFQDVQKIDAKVKALKKKRFHVVHRRIRNRNTRPCVKANQYSNH